MGEQTFAQRWKDLFTRVEILPSKQLGRSICRRTFETKHSQNCFTLFTKHRSKEMSINLRNKHIATCEECEAIISYCMRSDKITLLTIGHKVYKVSRNNPANVIKKE